MSTEPIYDGDCLVHLNTANGVPCVFVYVGSVTKEDVDRANLEQSFSVTVSYRSHEIYGGPACGPWRRVHLGFNLPAKVEDWRDLCKKLFPNGRWQVSKNERYIEYGLGRYNRGEHIRG